jgi:hypothetical protein
MGAARSVAARPSLAASRRAAVCHRRPDTRTAVVTGRRPHDTALPRRTRGCAPAIRAASNFDTRTRSRLPAKACRSTSSNASSATRTSASRPSTYKGSTTARSSTQSAPARRLRSRRAPACANGRRAEQQRGPPSSQGGRSDARSRSRRRAVREHRPPTSATVRLVGCADPLVLSSTPSAAELRALRAPG